MVNVTHRIATKAPLDSAIAAINTLPGLASWWTPHVTGSPEAGGLLQFRFEGPDTGMDMQVQESNSTCVEWRCVAGPEEWLDTLISFHLHANDQGTDIYFAHKGWAQESPFHYFCSMKWAAFLLSLKSYLDNGKGQPFPNDIQIVD